MSGPSFGPLEIETLHALSLGLQLTKTADGWAFVGSEEFVIDDSTIGTLVDKSFVNERQGEDGRFIEITVAGKCALRSELTAISHRTARWLKTLVPRRGGQSPRK